MSGFSFIGHFLSHDQFINYPLLGPVTNLLPRVMQEGIITKLPVAKALSFEEVQSKTGKKVEGVGAICPLLPKHFITNESSAIKTIVKAIKLAERQGCKIASLAGFTSVVGNEGEVVSKLSNIAITSGNTFTAALVVQSVYKAVDLLGINMKHASLAVVGASGDIGLGCLRALCNQVKEIVLAARNQKKLELVAQSLSADYSSIRIEKYVEHAVKNVDIVISATSALTTIIEPSWLSPGTIVCDVALPHNISRQLAEARDDILVYDGGLAKLSYPYMENNNFWLRMFGTSAIVGCLAESMILALEDRFENFSLGRGNIQPKSMDEIWSLGLKHGFILAPFQHGGKEYQQGEINRIRKIRESALK